MRNKGFTLIELLVVVAIIGVIASIGVVSYSGYISTAKDIKHKNNANTILKFLQVKSFDCEINNSITLRDKNGKNHDIDCYSDNKQEFTNLRFFLKELESWDIYKKNFQFSFEKFFLKISKKTATSQLHMKL